MPVGVVEVFDGQDVGVWFQMEWGLQACLVAINTWQDGDVVFFIKGLICRSIFIISILGCHVANDFIGVSIPKLLPDARWSVAMRCHDQ